MSHLKKLHSLSMGMLCWKCQPWFNLKGVLPSKLSTRRQGDSNREVLFAVTTKKPEVEEDKSRWGTARWREAVGGPLWWGREHVHKPMKPLRREKVHFKPTMPREYKAGQTFCAECFLLFSCAQIVEDTEGVDRESDEESRQRKTVYAPLQKAAACPSLDLAGRREKA